MRAVKSRQVAFIVGGICLLIIPLWLWKIAPYILSLPKNFSYQTNIFSVDNLYDQAAKAFSGDRRSVTDFSYQAIKKEDGVLTIKNEFEVRNLHGEQIFNAERTYAINSLTGMHVPGGDHDREGYLFAPRHLAQGDSFIYWHANYDAPAHMKFAGKEVLFGLPVYRYETDYEGAGIPQTKELSGLIPDVGSTRGITVFPHLQLWIEPVSGWLVKYQDDTTAYYYDLKTGERQNPWNKFENTFAPESAIRQVAAARVHKNQVILVGEVIPMLLFFIGLGACLLPMQKRFGIASVAVGGVIVIGYSGLAWYPGAHAHPLTIGIARWAPEPTEEYDANIQGFKDGITQGGFEEGTTVVFHSASARFDENAQRTIARSFVDEHVDLIYSLTTPATIAVRDVVPDIPIVFSLSTYPVETGLVHSLKDSQNNLVGTRSWIPATDQLGLFLKIVPGAKTIAFLRSSHEANSAYQLSEMRQAATQFGITIREVSGASPDELMKNLEAVRGDIDAVYSACDAMVHHETEPQIGEFLTREKLPGFACHHSAVLRGSILAVLPDYYEIGKLAGEKAVLILSGASPRLLGTDGGEARVVYLNQQAADRLGLAIPQDLLIKAKQIIH